MYCHAQKILVFPARAGMIRWRFHVDDDWVRIPRESGDDPVFQATAGNMSLYSPRERG